MSVQVKKLENLKVRYESLEKLLKRIVCTACMFSKDRPSRRTVFSVYYGGYGGPVGQQADARANDRADVWADAQANVLVDARANVQADVRASYNGTPQCMDKRLDI